MTCNCFSNTLEKQNVLIYKYYKTVVRILWSPKKMDTCFDPYLGLISLYDDGSEMKET